MEQLEKYFDTAFGAPDGVKKLRELILNLAFQGRLLDSDHTSQQFDQIIKHDVQQNHTVNQKYKNGQKQLIENNVFQESIELPDNWHWVRLGSIIEITMGQAPPGKDCNTNGIGTPFVKVGQFDSLRPRIEEWTTNPLKLVSASHVLICVVGATIGKINLGIECSIGRSVAGLLPKKSVLDQYFLYNFLKTWIIRFRDSARGSAQGVIGKEHLNEVMFPLPPIAEQRLIVERINELMSRCDEIEKLRAERDQKRLAVHTAAIRKLLDASDQSTFDDAWQFITRHFADLYTVRENVAELRKALLQLAVMGKLVKQDPKEGTARELIKRIEKEKEDLLKEGKMKKETHLPSITDKEMSFKIPSGWQWVRLSFITLEQNQGVNTTTEAVKYSKFGIPVVQAGNINSGLVQLGSSNFVDTFTFIRLPNKFKPNKNEILYSNIGANFGVAAIVPDIGEFLISWNVLRLKVSNLVNIEYIRLWLNSPFIKINAYSQVETSTVPFISGKKIAMFCLPLPPKKEQTRIAKIINQLMNLCDRLEQQFVTLRDKQGEVLEAVMAEVN